MNLNNISKIGLVVICICLIIGISISRMINAHSVPKNEQKSIVKQNVKVEVKDTIALKGDYTNANVSIIVVDNAEYLVFRYGSKIEIVKHK